MNLIGRRFLTTSQSLDIDNDDDIDAFVGDQAGDIIFWELTDEGNFATGDWEAEEYNPFGITNVGYFAAPTFVDIDGDGDFDAFIGEEYGNTIFFENVGTPTSAAFAQYQDPVIQE